MAERTDIVYNLTEFSPDQIDPGTTELKQALLDATKDFPKWYEIGSAKYRELDAAGQAGFPPYDLLPRAQDIIIEADDSIQGGSTDVTCRLITPQGHSEPARGIFLHFHGGGFTIGSSKMQDTYLSHIADTVNLIVISPEYRMAPEHVFPTAYEDCAFVAKYLALHAQAKYRCELVFLGGESAGGTLTATTILNLRKHGLNKTIKGIVFNYGCFDLSLLPSGRLETDPPTPRPFLMTADLPRFVNLYLPHKSSEELKSPEVSPLYNDLSGLGSALFIVGTDDVLLDDTVLMHFRWCRFGNDKDTRIRFFAGAPHAFMEIQDLTIPVVRDGWGCVTTYLEQRLRV